MRRLKLPRNYCGLPLTLPQQGAEQSVLDQLTLSVKQNFLGNVSLQARLEKTWRQGKLANNLTKQMHQKLKQDCDDASLMAWIEKVCKDLLHVKQYLLKELDAWRKNSNRHKHIMRQMRHCRIYYPLRPMLP